MLRLMCGMVIFVLGIPACAGSPSDVDSQQWMSGSYALDEFNGRTLPATVGQFPSDRITHEESPCFLMMDSGALVFALDSVELQYHTYSSCSGATNTNARIIGTLVRSGSMFRMIVDRPGGDPLTYTGTLTEDLRIKLSTGEWTFVFKRAP
jgi:hypothetical protein